MENIFGLLELREIDQEVKEACAEIVEKKGSGAIDDMLKLQLVRQMNRAIILLERLNEGRNSTNKGGEKNGSCQPVEPISELGA